MKNLQLNEILVLMELRKGVWVDDRKANKDNMCLVASIVDIEDDIKIIKRAIDLKKQYEELLNDR